MTTPSPPARARPVCTCSQPRLREFPASFCFLLSHPFTEFSSAHTTGLATFRHDGGRKDRLPYRPKRALPPSRHAGPPLLAARRVRGTGAHAPAPRQRRRSVWKRRELGKGAGTGSFERVGASHDEHQSGQTVRGHAVYAGHDDKRQLPRWGRSDTLLAAARYSSYPD